MQIIREESLPEMPDAVEVYGRWKTNSSGPEKRLLKWKKNQTVSPENNH